MAKKKEPWRFVSILCRKPTKSGRHTTRARWEIRTVENGKHISAYRYSTSACEHIIRLKADKFAARLGHAVKPPPVPPMPAEYTGGVALSETDTTPELGADGGKPVIDYDPAKSELELLDVMLKHASARGDIATSTKLIKERRELRFDIERREEKAKQAAEEAEAVPQTEVNRIRSMPWDELLRKVAELAESVAEEEGISLKLVETLSSGQVDPETTTS